MTNIPFVPVTEKKVIHVAKRSYKKTYMAIALAMMLIFVSVMFYMLSSVDESEFILEDTSSSELEDWNVYFVDSASDLPTCDEQRNGRLYYVDSTESFEVCTTDGWDTVEIKGADGMDGIDGQNGTSGSDGADGAQGPAGQDGISTLIQVQSDSNCPEQGKSFEIGPDSNGNGILDIDEIVVTVDVCDGETQQGPQGPAGQDGADGEDGADGINGTDGDDGADGQDGADGTNGSASPNTMLTSISSPPATMGCDAGGRVMQQGLDNGDGGGIAQNGVLESGEVDYTTTYCSKYSIYMVDEINSGGYGHSWPGQHMKILVGDTLYFSATNGNDGTELWAHDTSNHSTWQVPDINSGSGGSTPGQHMEILVGDTLYFSAYDGNDGIELWAHDTSNHSTWQVADIFSGSGHSYPGYYMEILVGDTLYFSASDGLSGHEMWAMTIEHSITYN